MYIITFVTVMYVASNISVMTKTYRIVGNFRGPIFLQIGHFREFRVYYFSFIVIGVGVKRAFFEV